MKRNRIGETALTVLYVLLYTAASNGYLIARPAGLWALYWAFGAAALLVNLAPAFSSCRNCGGRLKLCCHSAECLRVFVWSCAFTVMLQIWAAFRLLPGETAAFAWSAGLAAIFLSILFWNGIISVYATSVQLGIRQRVAGIVCGPIPVAHLFALASILRTVSAEVDFETEKHALDESRAERQICRTKYPLLLVHGVFFRDYKFPNYWGRIPGELKKNGAQVYTGNHQSAASVADSAQKLTERIRQLTQETGCGKVNIIAHSKGGLDCRYAASLCGAGEYIASITTINTPHRGCGFADYLLTKIPVKVQQNIENTYNAALKKLGDKNPDFMAAVRDLTAANCRELNRKMEASPLPDTIFCQSVGSKLNRAVSGKFPLNYTYPLVKYFDGPNDGLVSEKSFAWGETYRFLTTEGKRGISHGDMIDMNRENIPGFDVREFYVQLAAGLKDRGL